MRLFYFVLLALFVSAASVQAQPCRPDLVSTSPGIFLFMSSGQTFRIFPTDNHISMTWLPMDKLTVCRKAANAYEITNLTRRGEQVEGLYLPPGADF
jgi:hypothetical protein